MRFSARTSQDRTENPLTVLHRLIGRRQRVLDLTVSNPTRAGIAYETQTILRALSDPAVLRYEPLPLGLASAREAVAADLSEQGLSVDPARVALTSSSSESYGFLFKILCDPGDEVLVPRPSYPLFEMLAAFESIRMVPYRLAYDGEWHVDLDDVRAAATRRTRAIVIVSPNNPTGSYVKDEELRALAALGMPIVSDEVFARYPLEATPGITPTALTAPADLVCVLGGLSKRAGLPQVKLGWIALGGEEAAVAEARDRLELVADASLSVSTSAQIAAPVLLQTAETARRHIHERVAANLIELRRLTESSAVSVLRVEGGWYAILRLPRTEDSEAWCRLFLERDGVFVHPGFFYDVEDEGYVVLSLLTTPSEFVEGVQRLVHRVEAAVR